MSKNMIESFDLTKIYKLKGKKKQITALNKVNLSIKEGERFGLLGPNGAGKTTMIHILSTLIQPTGGYATIDGFNILKKPKQARSRIGLMLDKGMIYYRITGYSNLKFFCKIYKVPNYKEKIMNMAKDFGLNGWLKQYVENYSSGMKMKLALFRTFLLKRKVLFMDEPTLGLDVKAISFIVNKIKELKSTILLTSHDMRVVERLCNRVAFIDCGNILKVGTRKDISKLIQKDIDFKIIIKEDKKELKKELNKQNYIIDIFDENEGFIIRIQNRIYFKELLSILYNYKVLSIKELELSLEDIFIKIV